MHINRYKKTVQTRIQLKNNFHKRFKKTRNIYFYNEFSRIRTRISGSYNSYLEQIGNNIYEDAKSFRSYVQL